MRALNDLLFRIYARLRRYAQNLDLRYYYYYIKAKKSDLDYRPESLQGNSKSYSKYIIIAHARSGSTLLISALRNHSEAVAYSELFLPTRVGSKMDVYHAERLRWLALRNKFPIEFLERQVFGPYCSKVQAVGFKLFPEQLDNKRFQCIWKWLDNHPEIKIIYLERENYLETYVSALIAHRERRYSSGLSDNKKNKRTLQLSLDKAVEEFEKRKFYNSLGMDHLKGHDYLMMTYDELKDNIITSLEKLQNVIGLKLEDLNIVLRKQESRSLERIIENYKDIESGLRDTEWFRFLKADNAESENKLKRGIR